MRYIVFVAVCLIAATVAYTACVHRSNWEVLR